MGALEIVLLLAGLVAVVLGFVLPVNREEGMEDVKRLAQAEIKELVSNEMKDIKAHMDDVVEETVTYAMEKTERSLERLSNEKIMAVNEYSDTVLQEINRNHNEVMFLYDMLNDKHKNLKNTVQEVNKTVKEVAETKKEAEEVVNTFQMLAPEMIEMPVEEVSKPRKAAPKTAVKSKASKTKKEALPSPEIQEQEMVTATESFKEKEAVASETEPVLNSNERILELYGQGMDKVDIARELGLGVGEVKLVIDLFKNI